MAAVARGDGIKQTEDLSYDQKDKGAQIRDKDDTGNLDVKRVLIYRLGSLGDMVVALPALHLVARVFPDAERRMLTNVPINAKAPAAAAVLEGSGLVHGYFKYSVGTRSLRELASLWWQLVRWRPQVLVYMAASRGVEAAKRDARFFSLCGIRRQIGVPLTVAMQENFVAGTDGSLEPEAHRLVRNLAELGDGRLDDPASWDLRLSAAEISKAKAEIAKARAEIGAAGELPLIAISIGTKLQVNHWGAENWGKLLGALAVAFPGHSLVATGAAEEFEATEAALAEWRKVSANSASAVNLCGRLTPRESAAVMAQARVFIGHDSGPTHLAAAVQTPCVAIFAARHRPGMWFPYGPRHRVIYRQVDCFGCGLETCVVEKKRCILSITVDEVMAEVRAVLG